MKNNIFISLLLVFGLSSCVGLEQYPTNSYTDDNFWNYESNVRAALYLAYNQLNGSEYLIDDNILSDDVYGSRHSSARRDIAIGTATTDNGRFSGLWSASYQELRTIHTALDNLDRMNADKDFLTRMEAELRLMRAYTYLRLVTWYGDVPFFTTNPTLNESKECSRTSASTIKEFIHSELLAVAEVLPKNTEIPAAENGRLTCGAAIGLNARAYLFDNDFENCAKECEKLLDSDQYGTYTLESDFGQLFSEGYYGSESMMTVEYAYEGGVENILRGWSPNNIVPQSIGQGEVVIMSPTQELVDAFKKLDGSEAGDTEYLNRDKRFYYTVVYNGATVNIPEAKKCSVIGSNGVGSGTYTCWTNPDDEEKALADDPALGDSYQDNDNRTRTGYYTIKNYNASTIDSDGDSYKPLIDMRWAEVLLMYAESKNELGQMTAEVWNKTIKLLRERAGFEASYRELPASGDLREIIRTERRAELALEGKRPYDIRRYAVLENSALPSTGAAFLTSQATGAPFAEGTTIVCPTTYNMKYWFAIPQSERDINHNLTQNPGW